MRKLLNFTFLLVLASTTSISLAQGISSANGPAPQNQPPGQVPILVGGQFNTLPAVITPGNMTPLQLDSLGNLKVNLSVGSITGAGTALTDASGFTGGSSSLTPIGGTFNDTLGALSAATAAAVRMTAFRALHMNLRDSLGNEYSAANPFPITLANVTTTAPLPVSIPSITSQSPLPVTNGASNFYVRVQGGNALTPVYVTTNPAQPVQVVGSFASPVPVCQVPCQPGSASSVSITGTVTNNVAQFGGNNVVTGTGASGTGIPRVTVSNDSTVTANAGTGTFNSQDAADGSTGSAVPTKATLVGGNGSGNLTAPVICDHWAVINQTAGAQVITGASSKQTYICSFHLVTATAQNIALVEGTGSTCATGTAGMSGGSTAATGWNFAANGGMATGSGVGAVNRTITAADNVCILQSGTGQVSGTIGWTQF